MRRALAVLTLVVCSVGLAGCGDEETPEVTGTDGEVTTIEVSVEGTDITPNGERVEVGLGQPIQFVVQADAEGSIHVHSEPERELKYGEGTSTLPEFSIDQPGVVEVESHALDKIIVQLEVS